MGFTMSLTFVIVIVTSFAVSPVPNVHAYVPGFVPGESTVYSDYNGIANPYPANEIGPIFPTQRGPSGPDDLLFQNLLSAEWAVYNLYQQGVETFKTSDFTAKGYKSTTYERIVQIRDNEAGHLTIFQEAISPTSLKPGPCKYVFPFHNDPTTYLILQTVIEAASMAFLSALALQAKLNATKGALVAIAEVETRHLTWGLIDVWGSEPFSGPADTVYPYVNQILETTRQFIIPGSCPKENPVFPNPRQGLPQFVSPGVALVPGANVTLKYADPSNVPSFKANRQYWAVFFHGVLRVSKPFDVKTSSVVLPKEFENRGIVMTVLADCEGAPTEESVIAGPLFTYFQPPGLPI
jgi:hypothetical protein